MIENLAPMTPLLCALTFICDVNIAKIKIDLFLLDLLLD